MEHVRGRMRQAGPGATLQDMGVGMPGSLRGFLIIHGLTRLVGDSMGSNTIVHTEGKWEI